MKRASNYLPKLHIFAFFVVWSSSIPAHAKNTHATLQRAEELAKAGKAEESNSLYREVLRSAPRCWQAYLGIGRNYFGAGQYENASAALEKAFELQPSNPELFNWLGHSYIQQHHPEKIQELLNQANSAIANSAFAHLLLARVYDTQDKVDEAKSEVDKALQIDPRCHGGHFALGFLDWSIGELPGAEKELRQEVDMDRHETVATYYLAEVLEKQGKLDQATAVLTQMGRAVPNTYLYHLGLGKLAECKKDRLSAAEEYREAIRLDPRQPDAHYRLAVTLRALKETAQANDQFKAFSELESHMASGTGQGMGRMRPHLPDFD